MTVPTPNFEHNTNYPTGWTSFGTPSFIKDNFGKDAMDADGVDDRLERAAVHTSGDDVTVAAWVNVSPFLVAAGNYEILSQWQNSSTNKNFRLTMFSDLAAPGFIEIAAGTTSANTSFSRSSGSFDDGLCHYLHGRVQVGSMDLFDGGSEIAYSQHDSDTGAGYSGFSGTTTNVAIAQLSGGTGTFEPGRTGKVKIWTQALSDGVIAEDAVNELLLGLVDETTSFLTLFSTTFLNS